MAIVALVVKSMTVKARWTMIGFLQPTSYTPTHLPTKQTYPPTHLPEKVKPDLKSKGGKGAKEHDGNCKV